MAAASKKKKAKKEQKGPDPNGWLLTYSDLITLLMTFFVIFFNPDEVTQQDLQVIVSGIRPGGIGALTGGLTLTSGRSADLGNTIRQLPSMERGRVMGQAMRRAVSLFSPEIRSNMVRITHDERGVVITLASDAFFQPGSARIDIEQTRDTLLRLGSFLASPEVAGRTFRIEGHTDGTPVDPNGPWDSNWELSALRSINVLHYFTDLGVDENRFQIAGFADTAPVASNATPEGRAFNRRVDIIIVDDGHL
ncbi:MAG: flagellar motor protein MotB [Treponema sp.]|nr:flagellar motor protein MotB [Treponema sp.]